MRVITRHRVITTTQPHHSSKRSSNSEAVVEPVGVEFLDVRSGGYMNAARRRAGSGVGGRSNGLGGQPPAKLVAAPVPRLALNVEQACAALGVSWDVWREHVEPGVRLVRVGSRKLVPVAELERWLSENAETALERR